MLMEITTLLDEISAFCGQNGIAESTFGRLAINDGKLMNRLRTGGRVTEQTCARIRDFMRSNPGPLRKRALGPSAAPKGCPASRALVPWLDAEAEKSFRFYDNRQKYLLFVTTSSEKWMVADRATAELENVHPRPPAVRLFDAGVGDGSVLARLMRAMHCRFPTMPFYVVGKEISLENVRLALEKMPDRFCEHPATVLVMTNMNYVEAPWLAPRSVDAATTMVWHELALTGTTGHEFERQITNLQPLLSENWLTRAGSRTGGPVYERPVVLVIYRKDYRFMLDPVLPRKGVAKADFDFVLASQPYRARASVEFKARSVVAPLARALGPGGRLLGVHSHGDGPGLEIVRRIWPDENPFETDRHHLLREVKAELGLFARGLNFHAASDAHSRFRYEMYTLPTEVGVNIGSSTLLAAWNAAVYVAQIEDERLESVISHETYLEATAEVLRKYGGLWFWDESYVISRRQELA
jgi:SAM-dependent methyltransferase